MSVSAGRGGHGRGGADAGRDGPGVVFHVCGGRGGWGESGVVGRAAEGDGVAGGEAGEGGEEGAGEGGRGSGEDGRQGGRMSGWCGRESGSGRDVHSFLYLFVERWSPADNEIRRVLCRQVCWFWRVYRAFTAYG